MQMQDRCANCVGVFIYETQFRYSARREWTVRYPLGKRWMLPKYYPITPEQASKEYGIA